MRSSHSNRHAIPRSLGILALVLVVAGCAFFFPFVPEEDSGDYAYVRQIKPILHGSKVRGRDEVKLLSDIIQVTDRETLLRALMEQKDFVDQWSENLVDDLRIAREGTQSQQACFGNPLRAGPDSGTLANSVVNTIPQAIAPGGAFNQSDLTRSSVVSNLYPLYRLHLYTHQNRLPNTNGDEVLLRDILGAQFAETYLNRQMGCLNCHNSESSTSGADSGWNRTYPILVLFEKALFGVSDGEPTKNAYAVFRSDNRVGPLSPWGIQSCGTYKTNLPNDPENANAHFVQPQGMQFGVHDLQGILHFGYLDLRLNGLQRSLPVAVQETCDFCDANCEGVELSVSAAANGAVNAAQVKAILTSNAPGGCRSCHGGAAGLYFTTGDDWANDIIGVTASQKMGTETRVIPGNANNSYLIKKLENHPSIDGGQMPPGGMLSNFQINQIKDWINDLPMLTACAACETTDCGQIPQDVAGHEAFAYLLAARIVDNVWEEAMGYPVTIDNYFPRNFAQRQILWNLTEYNFIPSEFSLKDLLVRILTSNFFNRVPPRTTAASTAYGGPPVSDPWTVFDPRVPPVSEPGYSAAANPQNHKNAMTEAIYRYSARSLTNSVHKALDWPAPVRFPGLGYPDDELQRSIGFFFSEQQPGFQSSDFQGLLAWESVHGRCQKPDGVSVDWIDKLMDEIDALGPPFPGGPPSVEEVAIVVRDWLLGHGGIGSTAPVGLSMTEEDTIAALFGVGSINANIQSVANLEDRLRDYCGILLQTGQFWLAGIAPDDLGPEPILRACNTPDCTYQEMCLALKPAVDAQLNNQTLICGTNSVGIFTQPTTIPPYFVAELCPPGICALIADLVNPSCPVFEPMQPTAAGALPSFGPAVCPQRPPACDPRCARIDCCGGPLPPLYEADDLLVAWAEGATVIEALGVHVLPRGATIYEPLVKGRKVQVGDLIAISPGARFKLRTTEGQTLRTPKGGLDKREGRPTVLMMISGEQALQTRRPDIAGPARRVPQDRIDRVHNSAWARRGEGGVPLTDERRRQYQYPEEELGLERLKERGLLTEELIQHFRRKGMLK